jgi:PAS domain S-box-containing protein
MSAYLLLPLVEALLSIVLIGLVLKGNFGRSTHRLFSLYLLCLAAWGIIIFGMRASPNVEYAYSWEKWTIPLTSFMGVLFYHFSVRYTAAKVKRWLLPFFYAICLLFIPFAATNLVISGIQVKPYGYAPILGPIAPFWVLFGYLTPIMAFLIFIKAYRTSPYAEQRNRAAYIIAGQTFMLVGGTFDFLPILGLPLYPGFIIGNIAFCLLTTVAIVKYNLLDIRVVLRKGTAYVLTSAVLAIPFIAIFLVATEVFKEGVFPSWAYFIVAIVLALVLPQLWQWFQRWVDRWYYRDRYDYLQALENFGQQTQSLTDSNKLGSTMVELIAKALRSSKVYLLQPLPYSGDFATSFSTGLDNNAPVIRFNKGSALVIWLGRPNSMLSYEDIEIIPQLQGVTAKEVEILQRVGAELLSPLKAPTGQLSGILVLGKKLSEQPYNSEDRQLIYTICNQMSTNLENIRLYNESQQEVKERKRVEEALRESEEKYRALVENSPNLVAVYQDGCFKYANKAVCSRLGWTYEEVTSPSFDAVEKLTSKGSQHIVRENISKRLRGEYVSPYEINMKTREGSEFPLLVYGEMITYGGKPAIEYNFVDITERKQTEAQLRESEKDYRLLAESVSDVIWTVDINAPTRLSYISPSVTRLLGYTVEEAMSKKMEEVFTLESFEIAMKAFGEEMAIEAREQADLYKSRTLELQMNCKDGSVVPVEVRFSLLRGLDERSDQILAIARDITERKRAEETLREYQRAVEGSEDLIAVVDRHYTYQIVNEAFLRYNGLNRDQVIGHTVAEILGEETFAKTVKPNVDRCLQVEAVEYEMQHLYSGIGERYLNVRYYPLKNSDRETMGVVAIIRDITERKRMEGELEESQEQLRNLSTHIESLREAERTSIAREVHDELGQALTAIGMDMSWLNNRLPKEQEALIRKIEEMSRLIGKTIESVKRISTELRPGVLDDLGLMAAVEWQVQQFQERTRIKCELTAQAEDINLDRDITTGIFRILQEALTNVIRHANAKKVKVNLKVIDGNLVLQVIDNGKGITNMQIAHSKSFGLIGMRERARSLNGSFKIVGISGKGTTVTVSIPLNRKDGGNDKNTSRR